MGKKGIYMMVILKIIKLRELVFTIIVMEKSTKVHSNIIKKKEKDYCIIQMEESIKVFGGII